VFETTSRPYVEPLQLPHFVSGQLYRKQDGELVFSMLV
jgi:hypothetical protein